MNKDESFFERLIISLLYAFGIVTITAAIAIILIVFLLVVGWLL